MQRLAMLITALTLSVGTVLPSAALAHTGDESADVVILKLDRAGDLAAIASQYGLDPAPLDQVASSGLFQLRVNNSGNAEAVAQALSADPRVSYAEPDGEIQAPEAREFTPWASGQSSVGYSVQWAPTVLHLDQAHAISRGAGAVVAILDTGVDARHPALAGHVLPGHDFVDDDDDASDEFGHGTHVAGLVTLVAPDAQILPVRVLDTHGVGSMWRLAQGIVYARDHGASVINLSLSTLTRTRLINDLAAEEGEAVVVAAAGNSGTSVPEYPAAESNKVLSVAASTSSDTLATFSNRGQWVRVAAPGDGLISTLPGGAFATWSGTSMSTAIVSGEVALIQAQTPRVRARDAIDRVVQTAAPLNDAALRRADPAAALATRPSSSGGRGRH